MHEQMEDKIRNMIEKTTTTMIRLMSKELSLHQICITYSMLNVITGALHDLSREGLTDDLRARVDFLEGRIDDEIFQARIVAAFSKIVAEMEAQAGAVKH